jgi:hypothetical protein
VWLVVSPFLFPAFVEPIFNPLGKVLAKIPFHQKIGRAWIFIVPVVCFFAWYFIIKFYLLASRRFKFAVVVVIAFGMAFALAFHEQKNEIDWTAHGLNPNRPGFKPQVVILAGTTATGYFEIRMRGADYYYRRQWNNQEWKDGSWYNMELDIPDFAMQWGLHRGRFGTGGGGGSSLGRPQDLVLARRLWNGTNFIGANTNVLTAEERDWNIKEEFRQLENVGPFLIPKQIVFSNYNGRDETYTIRKVEFWNQPSTNWFWDVKQKYFDHVSTMRTTDLNEPGPFLGKK